MRIKNLKFKEITQAATNKDLTLDLFKSDNILFDSTNRKHKESYRNHNNRFPITGRVSQNQSRPKTSTDRS